MTTPKQNGRTLPLRKRGRKWLCDYRKLGSKFYPEDCPSGRKLFATKSEAEGAAQIALKDFDASRNTAFDFTPELRRIALNAFQELRDYNPEALRSFMGRILVNGAEADNLVERHLVERQPRPTTRAPTHWPGA